MRQEHYLKHTGMGLDTYMEVKCQDTIAIVMPNVICRHLKENNQKLSLTFDYFLNNQLVSDLMYAEQPTMHILKLEVNFY